MVAKNSQQVWHPNLVFFEKNSTFFNQNSQKVYSISHFTKIIIFHHLDGRLGKLVG
jgi:hypothetical protein